MELYYNSGCGYYKLVPKAIELSKLLGNLISSYHELGWLDGFNQLIYIKHLVLVLKYLT